MHPGPCVDLESVWSLSSVFYETCSGMPSMCSGSQGFSPPQTQRGWFCYRQGRRVCYCHQISFYLYTYVYLVRSAFRIIGSHILIEDLPGDATQGTACKPGFELKKNSE